MAEGRSKGKGRALDKEGATLRGDDSESDDDVADGESEIDYGDGPVQVHDRKLRPERDRQTGLIKKDRHGHELWLEVAPSDVLVLRRKNRFNGVIEMRTEDCGAYLISGLERPRRIETNEEPPAGCKRVAFYTVPGH